MAGYLARVSQRDCEKCKKDHEIGPWDSPELKIAKTKGKNCATCAPFPGVMDGNHTAYTLTQKVLTGEGIRIESLEAAMRIYRIHSDDRAEQADRVLLIANEFLKVKRVLDAEGRDSIREHKGKTGSARKRPVNGQKHNAEKRQQYKQGS